MAKWLEFELELADVFGRLDYTLCLKKNDTDVAGYIFNAHQPILVVFGREIGERVCYWMVICYPTSPN